MKHKDARRDTQDRGLTTAVGGSVVAHAAELPKGGRGPQRSYPRRIVACTLQDYP